MSCINVVIVLREPASIAVKVSDNKKSSDNLLFRGDKGKLLVEESAANYAARILIGLMGEMQISRDRLAFTILTGACFGTFGTIITRAVMR